MNQKLPPASIRFNNPLAMYPGPSAKRYGSTGTERIGGGHLIAKFDDPVYGAAGNFDLMNRNYAGKTGHDFIKTWSGGNSVGAYLKSVGIDPAAVITREQLANPDFAVPLAMRMAGHEAGRPGALTEEQWRQAHSLAFGGQPPGPSGASLSAPAPTPGGSQMPTTSVPQDPNKSPFDFDFTPPPEEPPPQQMRPPQPKPDQEPEQNNRAIMAAIGAANLHPRAPFGRDRRG